MHARAAPAAPARSAGLQLRNGCTLGLLLLLAASGRAAAADADIAETPPIWVTDASGARFRVRFDPGERLILAAGAETLAGNLAGRDAEVVARLRAAGRWWWARPGPMSSRTG